MAKNKSKLTLLVDGNWLLMSRLYVISNKYVDDNELCINLKSMLTKSISIVLRQFPDIDNVIIVSDGGSWRNYVDVPEFLKKDNITYKGNRIKSDDMNWDIIFKSYNDWMQDLSKNGLTICREELIEGDDWAWYWSTKLNSENTNVIIWSKDKDLTQLVNMNKDKCFTIWWNADNGMYYKDTPKDVDEDFGFLLNAYYNENEKCFNNIVKACKKSTPIDNNSVILEKIVRGDAGDNIQPIILKKAKNPASTKKFKVAQRDIDYTINIHDDNAVKAWLEDLYYNKGYDGKTDKTIDEAFTHFKYNRQLIALEKDVYPNNVLDKFANYKTYKCSKDIIIVEAQQQAQQNNIQSILDII